MKLLVHSQTKFGSFISHFIGHMITYPCWTNWDLLFLRIWLTIWQHWITLWFGVIWQWVFNWTMHGQYWWNHLALQHMCWVHEMATSCHDINNKQQTKGSWCVLFIWTHSFLDTTIMMSNIKWFICVTYIEIHFIWWTLYSASIFVPLFEWMPSTLIRMQHG